MIVCSSCGLQNDDTDAFCGGCGAFLEWEGEAVAPQPAPAPEPPVVDPVPERAGLVERVVDRFHGGAEDDEVTDGAAASPDATAGATDEASPADAQEPDDGDDADRSEPERADAAARAEAEAETVRRATEEAEAAEQGKREAEAEAQREAESAERARRAASLVARPKPAPPPAGLSGPGATPPGAPPRRRRGSGAAQEGNRGPGAVEAAADATAGQPGAVAPKAVHPGKTRRRPTPKQQRDERRRVRPGDVICGQCGEGNDPERRFCRRCGGSLVDAEPARKARWWHRLRRKPKVHEAGARPMRRGGGMKDRARGGAKAARGVKRGALKVVRILAVLALVAGAVGITVGPWREPAMQWATDRFDGVRQIVAPRFEPLSAVSAEASSHLPDRPAQHAVDLLSTTWWAAGDTTDDGVGQRLFIDLGAPADIGAIVVTPGAADTAEYVAQPRPRRLHLVFDTGETRTLDIEDSPDPQSFRIDTVEGASNVEVQVDQVWRGQSGSHVSLTQIEFQTRG